MTGKYLPDLAEIVMMTDDELEGEWMRFITLKSEVELRLEEINMHRMWRAGSKRATILSKIADLERELKAIE